ncbi:9359_t:CDS:2 [Funneliformis mosseae]|uniref:9359_t:CDS:1 n=1 Tax=Funneliformis mosseae TaxID=27381 RepID=A0A9N9B137_FUNMO|nr:9359_t:CDS:2 [Funneliformis mosseae]
MDIARFWTYKNEFITYSKTVNSNRVETKVVKVMINIGHLFERVTREKSEAWEFINLDYAL